MNSSSKNLNTSAGDSEDRRTAESMEHVESSVSSSRVADSILELINLLRDSISQEVEGQTISGLLTIAKRGDKNPPSILELAKLMGVSDASASRTVSILGRGLRGKTGAGLVETREDPLNYSRKLIYLTPKGVRLMQRLGETMIASLAKWR